MLNYIIPRNSDDLIKYMNIAKTDKYEEIIEDINVQITQPNVYKKYPVLSYRPNIKMEFMYTNLLMNRQDLTSSRLFDQIISGKPISTTEFRKILFRDNKINRDIVFKVLQNLMIDDSDSYSYRPSYETSIWDWAGLVDRGVLTVNDTDEVFKFIKSKRGGRISLTLTGRVDLKDSYKLKDPSIIRSVYEKYINYFPEVNYREVRDMFYSIFGNLTHTPASVEFITSDLLINSYEPSPDKYISELKFLIDTNNSIPDKDPLLKTLLQNGEVFHSFSFYNPAAARFFSSDSTSSYTIFSLIRFLLFFNKAHGNFTGSILNGYRFYVRDSARKKDMAVAIDKGLLALKIMVSSEREVRKDKSLRTNVPPQLVALAINYLNSICNNSLKRASSQINNTEGKLTLTSLKSYYNRQMKKFAQETSIVIN